MKKGVNITTDLSIPFYLAFYSLILQFHKYQSFLTLTIKVTKVQTEEIEPKEISIEKANPLKCNLYLTQQIKYIFPKKKYLKSFV